MPEPRQDRTVHDPQVLRAIAHPVRNRILGELDARGPMRAADVARVLDVPPNQASFHLRQLAKYGLVEEDPEAARDRRDRVWRPAQGGSLTVDLEDVKAMPGGEAAGRVYLSTAASWAHVLVDAAFAFESDPDEHRSVSESTLLLSKEEARALTEEVRDVVDRWVERTRGQDDGDRRTYVQLSCLLPRPGHAEPGAGQEA